MTACCVVLLLIGRLVQMTGTRTPAQRRAAEIGAEAQRTIGGASNTLRDGDAVTLTGTVRAGEKALVAPLSGVACVFYVANARTWRREGRSSVLQAERRRSELQPFILETRDGDMLIDGASAETSLETRKLIPRNLDREIAFMKEVDLDPREVRLAGFDECSVKAGDRISVYGVVVIERAGGLEAAYREEPTRTRLIDHPSHRLTIGTPKRS